MSGWFEILDTPENVKQWCREHKECKGCRFAGNECVAPVSNHLFSDWQRKIFGLIAVEQGRESEREA